MTTASFIDACVMECYFRESMAARDLLFHGLAAPHLADYPADGGTSEAKQREFLTHLHATLNTTSHLVRNRLDRICTARPDLLAIIKEDGSSR